MIALHNGQLSITVNPHGAELTSVTSRDGREWLWNGNPRYWNGRAPVLFPVVGGSPGNEVKIGGRVFPMQRHGFARRSVFSVAHADETQAVFRLSESEATLASFPFRFDLDIAFALEGSSVVVTASVMNRSDETMPFGFGFHPAFLWPLPGCEGLPHLLWLDVEEEPRTRRLDGDSLLVPEPEPSVFTNGLLTLEHRLFDRDAVILDDMRSRDVSYGVPNSAVVTMTFEGMEQFGIWTKPDGPFLCLEPWQGMSAGQGAPPDLEKRPGTVTLAPGDTRTFKMRMTFPG